MLVEKIIQDWLKEINYNKPVMMKKNYADKTVTIMTTNPGILIGKCGKDIANLQSKIGGKIILLEADEIICTKDATIDTRDWDDIIEARVAARFEMWEDM